MGKRIYLLTILVFLACVTTSSALWLNQTKSLEGVVKDVGSSTLVITKQTPPMPTPAEEIREVSIEVDDNTKFQQVASLSGIAKEDTVKVEYREKEGRMIATMITKLESGVDASEKTIQENL